MDRSIAVAMAFTGLILLGCSAGSERAPGHVVTDVWFAKAITTPGARAPTGREPRAALPPEVTEFSTSDPYVYMWLVTRDTASHRVRGTVKPERGTQTGMTFTFEVRPVNPDSTWQSHWYRIPMSRLGPGKWTVDLLADDLPVGTYSFVVK